MVNFLQDPEQNPHLPAQGLYQGFGVSQSNALAKSKAVRDVLDMNWMDLDWCLPSRLHDHPMAWMVYTDNGMIIDARSLAREDQVLLHRAGLIPYVHADHAPAPAKAPPAPPATDRREPEPQPRGEVPAADAPASPQLELF